METLPSGSKLIGIQKAQDPTTKKIYGYYDNNQMWTEVPGQFLTNVKDFGAIGDGIVNDTAAIQNALDVLEENGGGMLFFPFGIYTITTSLQVNSQVLFMGAGSSSYEWFPAYGVNNKGSVIQINSTTLDAIVVNVSGCSFQNIGINNSSVTTPTAGTGIKMLTAGSFNMNNVSVKSFFNNIDIKDGTRWSIQGCNFFFPINYGIYIHSNTDLSHSDTGDTSIIGTNVVIDREGVTGIKYESSGGLKISNSKVNPSNSARVKVCIDFQVKGTSSILLISNCSFEGFSERAIKVTTDGVHTFDKILLNGNQMESYSDAITCVEIQGGGEFIRSVNIVNNIIMRGGVPTSPEPAILINAVAQANLSDNLVSGFNQNHLITNTPSVYDADGYGGTVKGQLGIGNINPSRGYRGFSNIGITLAEDISGIIIKTDLNSTVNSSVNLIITGCSASNNLPIESHLQCGNIGDGTISGATVLSKGLAFQDARIFYLDGKLCFWVKPTQIYSNFNFEIQTSSPVVNIVERLVGVLPSGRTGEVICVRYKVALLDDIATGQNIGANTTGNAATATTLQTARTINGVSFNGSSDITIPVGSGTVTSVGLTAPTGLTVTASPITTTGNIALSYTAGYAIPTTAKQTQWDTAFGWGNHAGLYPTYNGTGATGTWGINISGNAATATTAGNSTLWASNGYEGNLLNPATLAMLYNGTTNKWGAATQAQLQTLAGINSGGENLNSVSLRNNESTIGLLAPFFGMPYRSANLNSRSWRINNDSNVFGDFSIDQSTTQTGSVYSSRIYVNLGGNVGIGTTAPAAKLDVNGSIKASDWFGGGGVNGAFGINYNTGLSGGFEFYGGTTAIKFSVDNSGNGLFNGTVSSNQVPTIGDHLCNKTYTDLKAPLASPTFTGTVSGITKGMVGLGNVDNTSDATKFTNTPLTGVPTAPTATLGTNTTQLATTAFVQAADAGNVKTTGTQSIAGLKTFTDKLTGDGGISVKGNDSGSPLNCYHPSNGRIQYALNTATYGVKARAEFVLQVLDTSDSSLDRKATIVPSTSLANDVQLILPSFGGTLALASIESAASTVQTSASLNASYPSVGPGQVVIAPSVGTGMGYIKKIDGNWMSFVGSNI